MIPGNTSVRDIINCQNKYSYDAKEKEPRDRADSY